MDSRQNMRSLGDVCNELKHQYDDCFNAWFSEKFLKGDTNDSSCATMFNVYQQCLKPCKELKEKYDNCFNLWFADKFLKGKTNDSQCAPLLKVYTECVEKAMKDQQIELHDVQVNHLGTEKEKVPPS